MNTTKKKNNKDLMPTEEFEENLSEMEQTPRPHVGYHERVFGNGHNANIILRKDYKNSTDTEAGAIDLVAGMLDNADENGNKAMSLVRDATTSRREAEGKSSQPFALGDMERDSARVYISQKSDIDFLLGLRSSAGARSAVAIKADAVRVVSRDTAGGIRLVVKSEARNSQGGPTTGGPATGVTLEAQTFAADSSLEISEDEQLQPMVKSHELAKTLADMMDIVMSLKDAVHSLTQHQKAFNRTVANEVNLTYFYGTDVIKDPNTKLQCGMTALNMFDEVEFDCSALEVKFSNLLTRFGVQLDTLDNPETGLKDKAIFDDPVFASKFHKLN